jgi:hypothetical protein
MKNELSYPQFYLTLPQKEAEANVHAIYGSTGDNLRHIPGNPDTLRRNIVLITIESMSASFMRLSGRDHAPPGLSLQNGDRFRTVFRHR